MDSCNGQRRPDYRRQNTCGYTTRTNDCSGRTSAQPRRNLGYRSEVRSGCGPKQAVESNCGCRQEVKQDCGCNQEVKQSCGCKDNILWGEDYPIGMAYVPCQNFGNLYEMDKALQVGTIFVELDKPFTVGNCARRCGCR